GFMARVMTGLIATCILAAAPTVHAQEQPGATKAPVPQAQAPQTPTPQAPAHPAPAQQAPAPQTPAPQAPAAAPPVANVPPDYIIGPGDTIQVFVWRNPELSATVPVRPDGKISTPLVEDLVAVGKTPAQLARDIETRLAEYVRTPQVNVIVTNATSSL